MSSSSPTTADVQNSQGFLYKYVNLKQGYQPRWLTLQSGFLTWYADADDPIQSCLGLINLRFARLKATDGGKRLTLEDLSMHRAKHYFKANTATDMKEWMGRIQAHVASVNVLESDGLRLTGVSSRSDSVERRDANAAVPSAAASPRLNQLLSPPMASNEPKRSSWGLSKIPTFSRRSSKATIASNGPSPETTPVTMQTSNFSPSVVSLISQRDDGDTTVSRDGTEDPFFNGQSQILSMTSDKIFVHLKNANAAMQEKNEQKVGKELKTVEELCKDLRSQTLYLINLMAAKLQDEIVARKLWQSSIVQLSKDQGPESGRTSPSSLSFVLEQAEDAPEEFYDAEEVQISDPDGKWTTKSLRVPGFEAYSKPRTKLPIESDERPSTSLWTVLKNAIGKDLTRITLPVGFNEPLSGLQRACEDFEYSSCLDKAAAAWDSADRILWVTAFAFSAYSSSKGRTAKPFNPLLGETFEMIIPKQGFRVMTEQVSHHPPIGAVFAEAEWWSVKSETANKTKFTGASVEIQLTGLCHVDLKVPHGTEDRSPLVPYGEQDGELIESYTFNRATCLVSNLIMGTPSVDYTGEVEILCHQTGHVTKLKFKPTLSGWRQKLRADATTAHEVTGTIKDSNGKLYHRLYGAWNSYLRIATDNEGQAGPWDDVDKTIWKAHDRPLVPFNFTPFAIALNDGPASLMPHLPPTDCRRRPDQRAFESGRYDEANDLKIAQEEKQRLTRKEREEGRQSEWGGPQWFTLVEADANGQRRWEPKMTPHEQQAAYWSQRSHANDEWSGIEHIFADAQQ